LLDLPDTYTPDLEKSYLMGWDEGLKRIDDIRKQRNSCNPNIVPVFDDTNFPSLERIGSQTQKKNRVVSICEGSDGPSVATLSHHREGSDVPSIAATSPHPEGSDVPSIAAISPHPEGSDVPSIAAVSPHREGDNNRDCKVNQASS